MQLQEFIRLWRLKYPHVDTIDTSPKFYAARDSNYLSVRCPFCHVKNPKLGADQTRHASAHYDGEWFKCLRCGESGTIHYLLGIYKDKKDSEPKGPWTSVIIDPNQCVSRPSDTYRSRGLQASRCKPGYVLRNIADLPRHEVAWEYLISEGFTKNQILEFAETYGIYYCDHGIPLKSDPINTTTGRLIFEIREEGIDLGWQARWLPKHWPPTEEDKTTEGMIKKYIISGGLQKSYFLYNWTIAQEWDMFVVVEGIKKVWKTGKFSLCGFGVGNNTQPPEGISHTAHNQFWSVRLANSGRPVVILYDKGAEAIAEKHAAGINAMGGNAIAAFLPEHGPKDLDDYTTPEIRKIIIDAAGRAPRKLPIIHPPQ